MNLSKNNFEWLKEKGERFYLTFRARVIPLIGLIILGAAPVHLLASLSQQGRLVYSLAFSILTMAMAPYVNNMVAMPMIELIHFSLYRKKYESREYSTSAILRLRKKMGLSDRIKVYVSDNPMIKGPFCNIITGKVFLPERWTHPEQEPLASISHEFGHIKYRSLYFTEFICGILVVIIFSIMMLLLNTIPIIVKIAAFAFELLVLTFLSRRNEFRADHVGAKYGGPEGLISLFEKLKFEAKWDDGSETHPSFDARINKLRKYLG